MNFPGSTDSLRIVRGALLLFIAVFASGCTSWSVPWSGRSAEPLPAPAPEAVRVSNATLQGSAWSTLYVQGVGATTEPRPYLQWTQFAQIAGSGGCNRFVGQAQVTESEQLRFASLASTRMACMPEPGGQEDKFFKALELTTQVRLEGDDLILLDPAGTVLAQLRRVEAKSLPHP